MRLSRLLLLGGIAYVVNEFFKTPKGQVVKKDLADKMDGWKRDVENMVAGMRSKKSNTVAETQDIGSDVSSIY
jgi:hypothetical protein